MRYLISGLSRSVVYNGAVYRMLCHLNSRSRIVMFHQVSSAGEHLASFRSQIAFLNRYFRIVSIDALFDAPRPKDGRPLVVLTFDDGFRNHLQNVYPLLRASSIPAVFYVCPGLIGSGRWLWNHESSVRLSRLDQRRRREFASGMNLQTDNIPAIIRRMKDSPFHERLAHEEAIRELTPGFQPTEVERDNYDLMTWSELKLLDSSLITVGGHTVSHPLLSQLTAEHAEREIADCRTWIESELKRPIRHFCYPDGAYTSDIRDIVGRHFETAVTTKENWVPTLIPRFELPRIPIAHTSRDLAWRMQRPQG